MTTKGKEFIIKKIITAVGNETTDLPYKLIINKFKHFGREKKMKVDMVQWSSAHNLQLVQA